MQDVSSLSDYSKFSMRCFLEILDIPFAELLVQTLESAVFKLLKCEGYVLIMREFLTMKEFIADHLL